MNTMNCTLCCHRSRWEWSPSCTGQVHYQASADVLQRRESSEVHSVAVGMCVARVTSLTCTRHLDLWVNLLQPFTMLVFSE